MTFPEPEIRGIDRLIELLEEAPDKIEIVAQPFDYASFFIAVATLLITSIFAISGAIIGARLEARNSRKLWSDQIKQEQIEKNRENYFKITHYVMDSINNILILMKHIDEELSGVNIFKVRAEGWKYIKPLAWAPVRNPVLPEECVAMLLRLGEGDAMLNVQNLIAADKSIWGNYLKFQNLHDQFTEEVDLIEGKNFEDENGAGKSFDINPRAHPKAYRLARTIQSFSWAFFDRLPDIEEDMRNAEDALYSITERHQVSLGLDAPFKGFEKDRRFEKYTSRRLSGREILDLQM